MADIELRFENPNSFCQLGPRPDIVTGYLRLWLATHFAKETTIEHEELRSLLWTELDSSELKIENIYRWRPSTTENRPAILIRRNDWQVLRRGIDDRMIGDTITDDAMNHYASFLVGSHTVFNLSPQPIEAEILAAEVYRELMQFGPVVREELDLKRFVVVGVGALFEVKEYRGTYAVPVHLAYEIEEKWRLIKHAPFLRKFDLKTVILQ